MISLERLSGPGFWMVSVAGGEPVYQHRVGAADTVVVPEPSQAAIRYHRSGNVLWGVETALGLLIPALILFTGFSASMRDGARRVGRRWLPTVAIYALIFTVVMAVITLPLAYYGGYVRQHAYGLSNQSLGRWFGDWLKGVAVSGVGLTLVLWIPYLLLRKSPNRWWLYAGLASIPVAALALVITPVWVDPLFNQYGPMKDKALEARILALADRAGIQGSRVYEVNKSVDTKAVNAYVTGLGGTKRIVLWDTILAKLEPDQVVFVMAHEMGHFVLRHTLAFILGAAVLTIASLYVVHRVAGRLIARFSGRFGFDRLSDVASFPLLLFLGSLVSFVMTPALLAFSRHQEHEADRFALEMTRANRAAGSTFVRLQQENLTVPRPGPLYMVWRGSHPSLGERVDFANRYRPWEQGEALRYGHHFR
ncbi:MAG TPA: M48 family metallopeptidase [Gemmatimonadales bacterium]|nr:M48 family metallopeptidase [Gemmatimonadales bacterium]